jgi:DNA-binding MurR/RpiR family transcriptional regulator
MTDLSTPLGVDQSPQNVISELRQRYDELTNSQKRIAETIVEDPEFVAFATVDKFATRIGVSPSTIVRFAYRIGLVGYPDLQEKVRELVRGTMRGSGAGDDPTAHLGDNMSGESLRHDLQLLSRTAERLQQVDVERAVELIVQADRVRVVGGVTAYSVAYYTAVTLDRVRDRVALLSGSPVPTGPLREMEEGDVLVAFSFPPYAKTTLGAIDAAKRRGASIIAISDSPISPLRNLVDVLLPAAVSGIGTQNSLVAAMAIANVIVNGVASQMPGALERYSETIRLLEEWDVYLLETQKGLDA